MMPKDEYSPELSLKSDTFVQEFCNKVNHEVDHVIKSPGRVNLIGEHIDYCGYPVLPATISQSTLIAIELTRENFISLRNTDQIYASCNIPLDLLTEESPFESETSFHWYQYTFAGFKAIFDYCKAKDSEFKPIGFIATIGNVSGEYEIPPGAGLSSSSALVVASAMAAMKSWNIRISKSELATICAKYECLVGTESGGMDQASCILGKKDSCLLVDFSHPRLITKLVSLPPGLCLVVAHSGVQKNKASSNEYNIRVTECRIACALIAYVNNVEICKFKPKIAKLQLELGYLNPETFLYEELKKIESLVSDEPKLLREFEDVIGRKCLKSLVPEKLKSLLNSQKFCPISRLKHVLGEASRVLTFVNVCSLKTLNVEEIGKSLGELMNQSHESCSSLYDCSLPELDQLTKICRNNGAYGSRLTGAGWGGCTVSLVKEDRANDLINNVKRDYYEKNGIKNPVIFITKLSDGAVIYK